MAYGIEEVDLIFDDMNEKIDKTMQNYISELRSIRAGRANPHILDKVVADYYGTPTPINNMANISVPEARLLVIAPWDKSQLKNIEKAILAANIFKEAKNIVEEAKIVMRNARREAIDELKKIQKASTITEDDLRNFTEDIDKNLAKKTEEVDKLFKEKEQEILSI